MKTIAIIGSGISGLVAAHLLSRRHEVSLFESGLSLGGHAQHMMVNEGDQSFAVDLGFNLFNDRHYPLFHRFLQLLGVRSKECDMSWGFHDLRSGMAFSNSGLRGFYARKCHLLSPHFWCLLLEMKNFSVKAQISRDKGESSSMTLRDFLSRYHFSRHFEESFLIPAVVALGLNQVDVVEDYPAESIFEFFQNHGLFDFGTTLRWRSVEGGSSSYVRAFQESFGGHIFLSSPVVSVSRVRNFRNRSYNDEKVEVTTFKDMRRSSKVFDAVVIATDPKKGLQLLQDPLPLERELLSPWTTRSVRAVLHGDSSFLPGVELARASWNFSLDYLLEASVTYDMNRLQGLRSDKKYLVTLNAMRLPDPSKIIAEKTFERTQFDLRAHQIRSRLGHLNARGPVFFAGSYFGRGFHEDGVASAVRVVNKLDPHLADVFRGGPAIERVAS